ncbi:MAG: hypothetical protein GXP44_03080 [bacterium]|nr:hypothetical protein [bacterium]
MKQIKITFFFLFFSLFTPISAYAWMCTGQDYSFFDICGNLFIPVLLLGVAFLLCGIVLLVVSAFYAFWKKNRIRAKVFLKFGLIILLAAVILLLLIFPPQIIWNLISVRETTP